MHFSRQLNCWSLRCSWSIACRRCSNYIFILHLTLGFNILRKDNCKPRRETVKFGDLVRLILEILRYISPGGASSPSLLRPGLWWLWCRRARGSSLEPVDWPIVGRSPLSDAWLWGSNRSTTSRYRVPPSPSHRQPHICHAQPWIGIGKANVQCNAI